METDAQARYFSLDRILVEMRNTVFKFVFFALLSYAMFSLSLAPPSLQRNQWLRMSACIISSSLQTRHSLLIPHHHFPSCPKSLTQAIQTVIKNNTTERLQIELYFLSHALLKNDFNSKVNVSCVSFIPLFVFLLSRVKCPITGLLALMESPPSQWFPKSPRLICGGVNCYVDFLPCLFSMKEEIT